MKINKKMKIKMKIKMKTKIRTKIKLKIEHQKISLYECIIDLNENRHLV